MLIDLDFDRPAQVLSGFISHHSSAPSKELDLERFCERNSGLGYKTKNGFILQAYRNSMCRDAVAMGYELDVAAAGPATARLGLGVAPGYAKVGPTALAYGSVGFTLAPLELVVGASPKIMRAPAVVWVQMRVALP